MKNKTHKTDTTQLFSSEGRDEMNLVEHPFTLLSKRRDQNQKTIELEWQVKDRTKKIIKKSWVVTGSDKWGLPTADGEKLYVALMAITQENGFKEQTIRFRAADIIDRLGWPKRSGESYKRLRVALQTLKGIDIYAANVFWDNKLKTHHPERAFSIIANYDIFGDTLKTFHVKWDDVLWQSFKASYIKNLDTELWFSLQSSISRRLFRFLDKHFYHSSVFKIELGILAVHHLGMSKNYYPSDIKRKLTPACDELIERGYLKEYNYGKNHKETVISFRKNVDPQLLTKSLEHPVDLIQNLVERGVSKTIAKELYKKYTDRIERQIRYFDYEQDKHPHRVAQNPGGYLRKRIEEDWAPHSQYVNPEELKRRAQQQEQQRKRQEWQSIIEQYKTQIETPPDKLIYGEMFFWQKRFERDHERQPTPEERATQQQELIDALPAKEELINQLKNKYQELFNQPLKDTEQLFDN